MFHNIGGKIKVVAAVFCWIGIIASVLFGAFIMFTARMSNEMVRFVVFGPVVGVAGSLLSWIMSFGLYGFGQLIENTDIIVGRIEEKTDIEL